MCPSLAAQVADPVYSPVMAAVIRRRLPWHPFAKARPAASATRVRERACQHASCAAITYCHPPQLSTPPPSPLVTAHGSAASLWSAPHAHAQCTRTSARAITVSNGHGLAKQWCVQLTAGPKEANIRPIHPRHRPSDASATRETCPVLHILNIIGVAG